MKQAKVLHPVLVVRRAAGLEFCRVREVDPKEFRAMIRPADISLTEMAIRVHPRHLFDRSWDHLVSLVQRRT